MLPQIPVGAGFAFIERKPSKAWDCSRFKSHGGVATFPTSAVRKLCTKVDASMPLTLEN